jgi:lipopolysaccharide/colanic/teichoic acid biosynthesis glycosyltransferase
MIAKRLFDIIFSFIGIIVLSPFLIVIALWIKIDSRGPIFFLQTRISQYNQPFRIIKFRTMRVNNKGKRLTIGGDNRITRSGYFLRRYKLDELPQLINVLKGDMSLVGPRPELPQYVALYPDEVKNIIFSVRGGMTDFASIEFSNESELLAESLQPKVDYIQKILPIKLAYHQKYVNERSLYLDIILIFKTFQCILGMKE